MLVKDELHTQCLSPPNTLVLPGIWHPAHDHTRDRLHAIDGREKHQTLHCFADIGLCTIFRYHQSRSASAGKAPTVVVRLSHAP